jgi:serine/threonine protein kinase
MDRIESHVEFCALCQEILDRMDDEDEPPGTTMPFVPGFHVYRLLGAGAFGEVWLAQDLNLPRVVAIKTLRFRATAVDQARELEALRRDAFLMTQVDHPNIVRVYVWLTDRDRHYLVMQYVSGGSLSGLLKNDGPLDWQCAARYVADVGEGLLAVHSQGIVHRDVKPSNILWDSRADEALLTDFGIASRLASRPSVAGSIPYMAPEALDGHVSPALDVYSLAATFFNLVTGSAPFPDVTLSNLKEQVRRGLPDPDPRCAGIPELLEQIIRTGLAVDPENRPGLQDFVTNLRATLNHLLADSLTMSQQPSTSLSSTELETGAGGKPPAGPTTVPEPSQPAPVDLRLVVSRQVSPHLFVPVAATHPQPPPRGWTRDMKKVPQSPELLQLRTGERVRIEVVANREGYLTVFNVGPTGNLNLLHPEVGLLSSDSRILPNRPVHIMDIELTPPTGRERLFAAWSRQPLRLEQLASLADQGVVSKPYRATRDMKRVQDAVHRLQQQERQIVVIEVEHVPCL